MRLTLLVALPGPAAAHVGHLGEVAGHDHWVAGAALAGAILAGILADRRRRRRSGREAEPQAAAPEAET
jgi:hypothetical protein